MSVRAVDPTDEKTLRAFWEVEQTAQRHDRPDPVLRSWEQLRAMFVSPNPYHRRDLWVALDGDTVIGAADLDSPLQDNTAIGFAEVNVLPDHRRRGVGTALHDVIAAACRADGRASLCGEVYVPADGSASAASLFAEQLGFEVVHREDHLVLRLPVADGEIERLRATVDATAYDVITWQGRCPDEHVEAFCAMRTRMENDVPVGEIDYEPVVVDETRLRIGEERVARSFLGITAAVRRRADGEFGGYSLVYVPHVGDHVIQDDTLVMPEHRGHRLGTLLKCATLEIIQREHRDRVTIHTDTALDNHAMQATNRDFGYRPVERLHEMQRRDG
ncbi:MAG: GNAT family N-acetyltransferase [Nocardioides sp.]